MTERTPFRKLDRTHHLNKISKRMRMERMLSWGIFFAGLKGKACCEGPFTLNRQQHEKDKQNVVVPPPLEKFLRTPMLGVHYCIPKR